MIRKEVGKLRRWEGGNTGIMIEYFRLNIEYLRYSFNFKKDGATCRVVAEGEA